MAAGDNKHGRSSSMTSRFRRGVRACLDAWCQTRVLVRSHPARKEVLERVYSMLTKLVERFDRSSSSSSSSSSHGPSRTRRRTRTMDEQPRWRFTSLGGANRRVANKGALSTVQPSPVSALMSSSCQRAEDGQNT